MLELFQWANDGTREGAVLLKTMTEYVETIAKPQNQSSKPANLVLNRTLITELACVNSSVALQIMQGFLGSHFFIAAYHGLVPGTEVLSLPYIFDDSTKDELRKMLVDVLNIATTHPEVLSFLHGDKRSDWYIYVHLLERFGKENPEMIARLLSTLDKLGKDAASKVLEFYYNKELLFVVYHDLQNLKIAIESSRVATKIFYNLLASLSHSGLYTESSLHTQYIFVLIARWQHLSSQLFLAAKLSMSNFFMEETIKQKILAEVVPVIIKAKEDGDMNARVSLAILNFSGYVSSNVENADRLNDINEGLNSLEQIYQMEKITKEGKKHIKQLLNDCALSFVQGRLSGVFATFSNAMIPKNCSIAADLYTLIKKKNRFKDLSFIFDLSQELHQQGLLAESFYCLQEALSSDFMQFTEKTFFGRVFGRRDIENGGGSSWDSALRQDDANNYYKNQRYAAVSCMVERARLIQEIISIVARDKTKNGGASEFYANKNENDFGAILSILAHEAYKQGDWMNTARLVHLAGSENLKVFENDFVLNTAIELIKMGKQKDGVYLLQKIPGTNQAAKNFLSIVDSKYKDQPAKEIETAAINLTREQQLILCKPLYQKAIDDFKNLQQDQRIIKDQGLLNKLDLEQKECELLIRKIDEEIEQHLYKDKPIAKAISLGFDSANTTDKSVKKGDACKELNEQLVYQK